MTSLYRITHGSPVPTHTVFGSVGATAMDPIAATGWSSKIGMNVVPPSVDFQTPPEAEPRYQVFGSPGTPATAAMRPAGAGPMYLNLSGSGVVACCGPCGPPPRCA